MNNIRVAILGATGRTGSLVTSSAAEDPHFVISGALVSPQSKRLGQRVDGVGEDTVCYTSDLPSALKSGDVAIDFSSPSLSAEVVKSCVEFGIPLLMATTGQDDVTHQLFEKAALKIPLLIAPNTSLAVLALQEAALSAQKILGQSYDTEIFEVHHKHKKDSPSGTALSLARALSRGEMTLIQHRDGKRQDGELGITSARGGDVCGDHTIFFFGEGERLELTQRASSRSVFAKGALTLAKRIISRSPGLYTPRDLW